MNWRNDIDVAVEKIKQVTPAGSPWEAGDLGVGSSAIDYHIAVIINAVVSGDLAPIEAAEARIAELEAALPSAYEWTAQKARIDHQMLRSMSASLSAGLAFSFNSQDMADLLLRMSEMVDRKPGLADLTERVKGEVL